jgi:type 1 glutamine amidotransferase
MGISRREWILEAGVLAAAEAFAQQASPPDWFDRPMRWAQLAFVEDDPGHYDPHFWLQYFARIHADAACLSAGGCVAFYPTKIPLHYRSKFLGDGDAFGEMLTGCRKQGMHVIARVDPHAAHQDVYDAHPDWIAVDAAGQPRHHWAMPELWVTCALGPYNFDFMPQVIREIMAGYQVDGIFANRWSGSGMCYCVHCRRNFREFCGQELPADHALDETLSQYAAWRKKRLLELYWLWDGEIKKQNPQAAFFPNGFDAIRDSAPVPILFADRQGRSGNTPAWQNGRFAKQARATFGTKPIVGLFSVGLEEAYRWKDSVQSPNEIRMWAVDGLAHGFRPWVIKFNAKPLDRRWFEPVEDLFVWHWKNERYLRNERPLARVGLVLAPHAAADHESGFYHALVEGRIPFEMVSLDEPLDAARLQQFRVLALPNIQNLSAAQCGQLAAFVAHGGGLVATHETSLYDERGRRRADFGLADLYGASFAGSVIERQQNAYLNIADHSHPLLAGLQDAGRMIHGVMRVEIRTVATRAPLMTVPSYPDLPMEEVYQRDTHTDIPGVMARSVGAGRVVYFPWDIDRTFWEVMHPDHGVVLANAVRWAANEEQPVRVEGPGILDVALWRQHASLTAHLVNLTNPMMLKGPVREIVPVGRQKVRVKIPDGATVRGVRFLVAGGAAQYQQSGAWLETTTAPIGLHEVVAVDL